MTHEEALELITPFYNLFKTSARDWDAGMAVLADDWKAYYTNQEYRTKEETRPFLEGLYDLVPDIEVEILQHYVDGDTISVRSELSGTPIYDFMVPDSAGKRFSIMTIDIHHAKDGKLVALYHAEDWMTARRQLGEVGPEGG